MPSRCRRLTLLPFEFLHVNATPAPLGLGVWIVNLRAVRHNERIRGLASLADNGALAFFIAAGAQGYAVGYIDDAAKLALVLGVALVAVGWYIRSELKPEN